MNYDIIAIGSATQDALLRVTGAREDGDPASGGARLCLPLDEKMAVGKVVFASGGGGTNAAVTFARQGMRTACLAMIGNDANGSAILDELRREGVDPKYIQMHDPADGGASGTAYSVVLVSESGERTILSYKGEGMHWQADRIPWDRLQAKWAYVNSLGGHEELLEAIVVWAKKNGTHLATNPGGADLAMGLTRLSEHWKSFDIVGMNEEEAAQLTGMPVDAEEAIFKKMDEAIGGIFIMTKGNQGVVVSDGKFVYRAGVPQSEAVERTGAGDAFHSGFVAEFMRSGTIEKAIQFATANATSVVMQYGAKAGILKKNDRGPWATVSVNRTPLV